MSNINGYLTFNGNCREAMQFYKNCLGGELVLQTVGESPMSDKMPEPMRNAILHATLTNGNLSLLASDMVSPAGLVKGNNISLVVNCDSEEHAKQLYKNLSEGGTTDHPLEVTFWGAVFGDLTDKYGNHWLIHFHQKQ